MIAVGVVLLSAIVTIIVAAPPSSQPPSLAEIKNQNLSSASFASTQNRCEAVFEEEPAVLESSYHKRTWAERQALGYDTQYAFRRFYEKRVSGAMNGWYRSFFQEQYIELEGAEGTTTIVSGFRLRRAPPGLMKPLPFKVEQFATLAERAVAFVIQVYRDRRPHWTESFLRKLDSLERNWLYQSIYIVTQDGIGNSVRGKIHAALRLIVERHGKVPMERYLGISVDVGDKLKVEPGNYAVEKESSAAAWPEIMMHLLGAGAREIVEGKENHYLTYADEQSLDLYSNLGFTPIDLSKVRVSALAKRAIFQTKHGPVEKIFKDGIWWTPMEASQQTLDQIVKRHVSRLEQRGRQTERARAIVDRQTELTENPNNGLVMRNIFGLARIGASEKPATLQLNTQVTDDLSLSLNFGNGADSLDVGLIPRSLLPLREGVHRANRQVFTYQNGVLTIEVPAAPDQKVSIRTTPDLKLIQQVTVQLGEEHIEVVF